MLSENWDWQSLGFWGAIALLLALWAVFHIVQAPRTSPFGKAIWLVAVLFLPVLGFLAWLLFGPRAPVSR